jgi:hypothetical protein
MIGKFVCQCNCSGGWIIEMDLKEIGWDSVDWIDVAQERDQWRALVKTMLNLRVP